jgi:hypothetical protein
MKFKNLVNAKKDLEKKKMIRRYNHKKLSDKTLDMLIGNYGIEIDCQIDKIQKAFNRLVKLDRTKMLLQQEKARRDNLEYEKKKRN